MRGRLARRYGLCTRELICASPGQTTAALVMSAYRPRESVVVQGTGECTDRLDTDDANYVEIAN